MNENSSASWKFTERLGNALDFCAPTMRARAIKKSGFEESMTQTQTRITDLNDYMLYISNKEWTCVLDTTKRAKTVRLGLLVEAIDMRELDNEHDNDVYPVILECSVVVDAESMSKAYLKKQVYRHEDPQPREAWQQDSYSYSGGAPVDMEAISGSAKSTVDNEVRTWFNQRRGKFKTRQFRTIEDALQYARDLYAHNAIALFGLIGFILDKTVNLVGNTGWDIIGLQAQNRDY